MGTDKQVAETLGLSPQNAAKLIEALDARYGPSAPWIVSNKRSVGDGDGVRLELVVSRGWAPKILVVSRASWEAAKVGESVAFEVK
jgi:hypothetical protein